MTAFFVTATRDGFFTVCDTKTGEAIGLTYRTRTDAEEVAAYESHYNTEGWGPVREGR